MPAASLAGPAMCRFTDFCRSTTGYVSDRTDRRMIRLLHCLAMSEAAVLQSVLVLDDNPAFCAMVEEILEGEGFRVRSCTDPGAALDTVIEIQPDLVISDWWMRNADGERLAHVILRDTRTAHVPLLVCTADGMIHNEIEALAVDGIEVIRKPFDLGDFIAAVGRKLDGNADTVS